MNIRIIATGALGERFLREAQAEYVKRLSGFCKLEIVEFSAVTPKDGLSAASVAAALDREADKILPLVDKDTSIALCIEGRRLSSGDFARVLGEIGSSGAGRVNFIIGSSHGLSERVKQAADRLVSFSDMTFPHQLFRIMLLEQIYRAFDINGAKKYDK